MPIPGGSPTSQHCPMECYLDVSSAVDGGRRHPSGDPPLNRRSPPSHVGLAADPHVSRTHAVLERIADRWVVRDVGSRNGTYVNGEQVREPVWLRAGDELRIGKSLLVLRTQQSAHDPGVTERQAPPPTLTVRERDVLLAIMRPLVAGGPFGQPVSTSDIARALWVTDTAVKRHLIQLYRKFGIDGRGASRLVRLASAALQCGAVSMAEVRRAA